MLAERLTRVPGASRTFLGGAVVYSDTLKTAFTGVSADLIQKHGAVSTEVAKALAAGIRMRTGASIGVGITGIAGPTGGTEEKPIGLVYIAIADGEKVESVEKNFRGDRQKIREWTTQQALDLLRRKLR